MKLSIVTVCFNAEHTIKGCLACIENNIAELSDTSIVEHIIVDGKSTDRTVEIVRSFCERNSWASHISESDLGVYDAYNKGLQLCNGDYVWYVNADDEITKDGVQLVLMRLLENPGYTMYCFSLRRIEIKSNAISCHIRGKTNPIQILSPRVHTPAIIWLGNELRETGGFDISYKICADFDVVQRFLFQKKKFIGFQDIVINMYLGGISSAYGFEYLKLKEQLKVAFNSEFPLRTIIKRIILLWMKFLRNTSINPVWRVVRGRFRKL